MERKQRPLEGRETTMKTYSLPPDADLLVATAESVAAVLEHKAEELGIGSDAQALLRASIASAYYGMDRYLTLALGREKSRDAQRFVDEAKAHCDRSIELLRRRITRSIGYLCRLMTAEDLSSVAERVIAVCA